VGKGNLSAQKDIAEGPEKITTKEKRRSTQPFQGGEGKGIRYHLLKGGYSHFLSP